MKQTETVDAYMARLQHPLKAEIEAVRKIILGAGNKLAERVKWNAPSFYYQKDFAAFNPRQQAFVQLIIVFYNGDMIHDSPILTGDYKDRRIASFSSMADVQAKKAELVRVVNEWVALIDK